MYPSSMPSSLLFALGFSGLFEEKDVEENGRIYSRTGLAVHKSSHFELIFAQRPQGWATTTPMTPNQEAEDGLYLFCTFRVITFHFSGLEHQLHAAKCRYDVLSRSENQVVSSHNNDLHLPLVV